MSRQVTVTTIEELPLGAGKEFVVDDKVIAIFRLETGIFAIDGLCPHAGGPIGTGTVRGCIVTCPWHGWQFDVSTGRHCATSNLSTRTYPVIINENEVRIVLET